jgi:hypothetical protein
MNWVALKMLTGDRSKYFGIVFGVGGCTALWRGGVDACCGHQRAC